MALNALTPNPVRKISGASYASSQAAFERTPALGFPRPSSELSLGSEGMEVRRSWGSAMDMLKQEVRAGCAVRHVKRRLMHAVQAIPTIQTEQAAARAEMAGRFSMAWPAFLFQFAFD